MLDGAGTLHTAAPDIFRRPMQLLPLIARRLGLLALPASPGTEVGSPWNGSLLLPAGASVASGRGTRSTPPADAGPESTGWPETQPCLYP